MDLELCTGDGCKNWPTRELVPPKNLFPSLLICEALTGPTFQIASRREKKNLFRNNWIVFIHGMDLELCTGDGCKNWPTRELVPPKISS